MLEYYFKQPSHLLRFRRGPLAGHLDGLAGELHQKGYQKTTGQQILSILGRFNTFARLKGIRSASQVDDALAARFLHEELACEGGFVHASNAVTHLTDYLQRKGVISTQSEITPTSPDDDLLVRYQKHLLSVRGLAQITCHECIRGARMFLQWYRERHHERSLGEINGGDALSFVTEVFAQLHTTTWKKRICSDVRCFFRYLRWDGIIDIDLDHAIPSIPSWQLAQIPRHLPWEKVRELIDSVDTHTPEGKREKAILLLFATLGLRSKEVQTLRLGDIAWKASEIHLSSTKSLRGRVLPITQEVGEALADYIVNGRPQSNRPEVFLKQIAPRGALARAASIGDVVKKRMQKSGINAPRAGSHMLRHSLATRLINSGVAISSIADLLGHANIKTTSIYTKVDIGHLASVALPFWEGEAR